MQSAISKTITRRMTIPVQVGSVKVGGGSPVVVQSMADTPTDSVEATVQQVKSLADAGSELVRITVNTPEAADAIPRIREALDHMDCAVPLIGDFHYNGHLLLKNVDCAMALAKFRINPGNVGFGEKRDRQFSEIIEKALLYDKPVRIGVNWGSLDQDLATRLMEENAQKAEPLSSDVITRIALVQSALLSAQYAESLGLAREKIILSCKVSRVQDAIAVYRELSRISDYALHLGLTEAGMGSKGIVATTAALSVLLQEGIGDTIRASLTPEPGGNRTQEVTVCCQILQSIGLRSFMPSVTACPGCGRTSSSFYQELAAEVERHLSTSMSVWKSQYEGVENLRVAVMGCIVNGPGESKHSDIGISLPGSGESPAAPVFIDGKKVHTLRGETIASDFLAIVNDYVDKKYPRTTERKI